MTVAAAFGAGSAPSIDVPELVHAMGAALTTDSVVSVDPTAGELTLASEGTRSYDALIISTGARREEAIPGAITFGAARGTERFRNLLAQAEAGEVPQILFAVPAQVGWPLPLYELALLTAERMRAASAQVEITLLTPEPAPLASFGGRASGAVLAELQDHGIHFIAGLQPEEISWGELRASPGKVRIQADAVVTLPRLRGPAFPGLPSDELGFVPVDAHGLVRGTTSVYAAGDAVAFPIKHGGLAMQLADVAADAIAARVGVPLTPAAFRPVLRGMLLTGDVYASTASSRPLWWPPAKIAGRYLAPYLSGQVMGPPMLPGGVFVELEIDTEVGSARQRGYVPGRGALSASV
jgi:sulfide:quinone oxidoreductase